jgi:hypothetical protein
MISFLAFMLILSTFVVFLYLKFANSFVGAFSDAIQLFTSLLKNFLLYIT